MKRYIYVLAILTLTPLYSVTFESVKPLIESGKVKTVEDLVGALPIRLFSGSLLVYRSRSVQGASLDEPRAILHDPSDNFFLTFNGSATQKEGTEIEILERKQGALRGTFYSIHFEEGRAHIETNPPLCFTCHTAFGNPLFDPASLWPGVYGSVGLVGHPLFNKIEDTALHAFLAKKAQHPRYKHLKYSSGENAYVSFVENNQRFIQGLYQSQAQHLARFFTDLSTVQISEKVWTDPSPGNSFVRHLPLELRREAEEAYTQAIPHICKRILTSTVRRIKSQISFLPGTTNKGTYPVEDLASVDAIGRAYAIASVLGILNDFKALSSLTVDRESYASQDGSSGLWGAFYNVMSGNELLPAAILSGSAGQLHYEGTHFYLSPAHPICGSFQSRSLH